eukprot:CAMPEP_0204207806 /NCGR_PEP_ID=MMETSP0361-20130328/72021_1 /ASSEMBLY_ACC=CAM_ASM_000343 /TAXON_ID=268821 /ORGANISM="Scrippsiella Hangoei, Strain SHTV-5" /LENGTH=54 /DNA_ID=CAMNT_0051171447 /DNA_START=126 /DNA_END=287 /DNA_ORIENTATION=+
MSLGGKPRTDDLRHVPSKRLPLRSQQARGACPDVPIGAAALSAPHGTTRPSRTE